MFSFSGLFARSRLLAAAGLLASSSVTFADLSHRQAPVTVVVKDQTGAVLEGANVKVEMLNPAFRFGTAIVTDELTPGTSAYSEKGLRALQEYFNSSTFGNYMKWTYFDSRPVATTLAMIDRVFALRAFHQANDFRLRGHTTLWGASYQLPSAFRALTDPTAVHNAILQHVTDYHTAFRGKGVGTFDFYNEHFHEHTLIIDKAVPGGTMAQQAAEAATWFKTAQIADPEAKLFINEYNILNFWQENDSDVIAYKNFVDAVRDAGGPVGGIGLQAHIDRMLTKTQIARRLSLLGAPMAATANHPNGLPGLPIEITELDINTQGWTTATPAQQAEVTQNILEAAFENPSVEGITIWGMRDSIHWRDNAILFDDSDPQNWVVKPSGQVWIDHVKGTWWTNLDGTTNAAGTYSGTAFKGRHRITATYRNTVVQVVQDLTTDSTVNLVMDTTTPDSSSGAFLSNLSVRASLAGGQNLSLGFVMTDGSKPVLARVAGPGLGVFGVSGVMPDPRLELRTGGALLWSNDNWDEGLVKPLANALGAFPLTAGSRDAAQIATVAGPTTIEIVGDQPGVMIAEVYDSRASASGPRLSNVSALNRTGLGDDVLTAGFTVGGTGQLTVLIRGVGPGLEQFGVGGRLADPVIKVFKGTTQIDMNDNWSSSLKSTMDTLGAFSIANGSADAALLITLDAGSGYSVQVSGADGGTGVAIIEVYEVH